MCYFMYVYKDFRGAHCATTCAIKQKHVYYCLRFIKQRFLFAAHLSKQIKNTKQAELYNIEYTWYF